MKKLTKQIGSIFLMTGLFAFPDYCMADMSMPSLENGSSEADGSAYIMYRERQT